MKITKSLIFILNFQPNSNFWSRNFLSNKSTWKIQILRNNLEFEYWRQKSPSNQLWIFARKFQKNDFGYFYAKIQSTIYFNNRFRKISQNNFLTIFGAKVQSIIFNYWCEKMYETLLPIFGAKIQSINFSYWSEINLLEYFWLFLGAKIQIF